MGSIIFIVGSMLLLISVITVTVWRNETALAGLIGFVSIPFLVFLLQIYRDYRGRTRNENGLCYKCGNFMKRPRGVYHYRSGTYYYCETCANVEQNKKKVALVIVLIALFLFSIFAFYHEHDLSRKIAFLLFYAIIIIVFVTLYRMKKSGHFISMDDHLSAKSDGHSVVQNADTPEIDEVLINETKRLLSGELEPETRRMLQHAIDEYESTKRGSLTSPGLTDTI